MHNQKYFDQNCKLFLKGTKESKYADQTFDFWMGNAVAIRKWSNVFVSFWTKKKQQKQQQFEII